MPQINQIAPRAGTAAWWASQNPILDPFEWTLESDTFIMKFGDESGTVAYNDTGPWVGGDIGVLTAADITDFSAAVTAETLDKADLVGGKVPSAQIPSIAIAEFLGTTANQAGMLALVGGGPGDYTIRTDTGTAWYLTGSPSTDVAAWTELSGGSVAGVTTVNSRTGAVTLTKADVGLTNVDNTADTAKPVSTAQSTADNLRLLKTANLSDITTPATARTNLGLGNVDNTSDANKPVSTATQTALNLKASTAHTHAATTVTYTPVAPRVSTNVQAAIDELAANSAAGATWPVAGTPSTFPPDAHSHPASQISDSTPTGRSVVTAADAQAARTAIGAMASTFTGLQIGTTATTAAAGNHVHSATAVTFTPTGALTATNVQAAIVQASQTGSGSGASPSIDICRYASGAYPQLPVSAPSGLKNLIYRGPVQPTSIPSWGGVGTTDVILDYMYAPLT